MTDDEAAYIEARGWKASVVPEPSIHPPVCTENPIRVDDVMESLKLAE